MGSSREDSTPGPGGRFRLGEWRVDPWSGEITRNGEVQRLEPKVMEVLVLLARHAGQVVSKEELLAEVWRDTFVTEDALWRCIGNLRKAFGDDPREPRYIETLPRRGYRLVAPCEELPAEAPAPRSETLAVAPDAPRDETLPLPTPAPPSRLRWWLRPGAVGIAAGAVLLLGGLWLALAGGDRTPRAAATAATAAMGAPPTPPSAAEELYDLGMTYYARQSNEDIERAIALLSQAVARDPDFARASAALSDAYVLKYNLVRPGDQTLLAAAERAARRALELDPSLAAAHKSMALLHQIRGETGAALEEYRRALALRPHFPAAANNLAFLYLTRGKLDEALRWYGKLNPRSLKARQLVLVSRGRVFYLLGDLAVARESVRKALELVPFDPQATEVAVGIDLAEGRFEAARDRARRCVEVHSGSVEALKVAGEVALFAGDGAAARAFFERAVRLTPKAGDREVTLGLAFVLWTAGEQPAARRLLETLERSLDAARRRGDDYEPYLILGGLRAIEGHQAQALDALEKAAAHGFLDHCWLELHPAFAGLRREPRFAALVEGMKARTREMRVRVARSGGAAARPAGS